MAATAISGLSALTAPAVTDTLIIVDDSASDNKSLALSYVVRDTGGTGAIVTGAYTLTLPGTGTAALLGVANVFTGNQAINVSGTDASLTIRSADASEASLIFGDQSDSAAAGILYKNSTDQLFIRGYDNVDRITVESNGHILIGTTTDGGQLTVDQSSASGAVPVLYLDQADVSEEMIQFESTIGTGNAIEAAAAKTLTTTHFIKVTITGGLTRYVPVGTIA